MKKRELQELRTKDASALDKQLSDLREKKLEVQMAVVSGKESNLKAAGSIKRDIAQVQTVINEKGVDK